MDICVQLGRRIRHIRMQKKIYQADLAEAAGIAREQLSRIENGRVETGIRTLQQISKVLDVSLSDLFNSL